MKPRSIEDVLWRQGYLGGRDLRITRKGPNGWQRAECPKCGYERAQVHYGRGLFWCPKVDKSTGEACLKVAVTREWSAVDQFAEMIVKVAGNASVRKYGDWLQPLEIVEVVEECLLRYDRNGDLDKWEAAVDGDPDKLRGYVFTALRGDVLNYARDKVARIRKGGTPDVEYMPGDAVLATATAAPWQSPAIARTGPKPKVPATVTYLDQDGRLVVEKRESLPANATWRVAEAEYSVDVHSVYPLLTMQVSGLTVQEIARAKHWSKSKTEKLLKAERERFGQDAARRRLLR
jgi:hypothetical protein